MKEKQKLAAEKFAKLAVRGVDEWGGELSKMELGLETEKQELGERRMKELIEKLPKEDGKPKRCPWCGKNARVRRSEVPRTFRTMSGEHTYRRNFHYCEKCKEGFYPMDRWMGLPEAGELSVELEKRVADFGVNDTYEFGAQRWNFLFPQAKISSNQLRQTMERLGEAAEVATPVILQGTVLAPVQSGAKLLYIMNDGGMVPMRRGEWNEVKVGVVFRDENHVHGTEGNRGVVTRARYVGVLGDQDQFKEELRAALETEGANAAVRLAWIADGAKGNWTLASLLAPRAIQILDFLHAAEHAAGCGKQLLGEGTVCAGLWRERITDHLKQGKVKQMIEELIECISETNNVFEIKSIKDLIRYFFTNRNRMKYDEYLKAGLLIGSGIVESAHRHVIQQRMKRSGQHWGKKGGSRMARLRAAYRTSGPERFYSSVKWAGQMSQRVAEYLPPLRRRASNR